MTFDQLYKRRSTNDVLDWREEEEEDLEMQKKKKKMKTNEKKSERGLDRLATHKVFEC